MTDNFYTILAWFVAIPNTFLITIFTLQVIGCILSSNTKLTIHWKVLIPFVLCGISYGWIFR